MEMRIKYMKDFIKWILLRLTCNHQYKCVYLASRTESEIAGYENDVPIYKDRRMVGEYEFECTCCGKRLFVPMDMCYQMCHSDTIN